ncbi:MAG: RsmB/NOP family class I SAM-dependent RNA methyltransferase, partial [Desulfurococcales archaeon]|nr:RsmB/NOP family class I SAM-dependent RNA methyltransferase [Desulfurococcales archaeon]
PPDRVYVRVNTLKVSVEDYLSLARDAGYELHVDEELGEALWAPVRGPRSIVRLDKTVVADKVAAESVMTGSDLFAPGVLYAKGVERGDRVSVVAPNGFHVGNGIALMSWDEIRSRGKGVAVRVDEPLYESVKLSQLPGWAEGLVYAQSLPAMYVAHTIGAEPGETIVDLTAAPGGKATHIAQVTGGKARIIAVDRPGKIERLVSNVKRLGMEGVIEVVAGDSRRLHVDMPSLAGKADRVLLDPPCTDIGVIPKVYDRKRLRDAAIMHRYQVQFLTAARRLLKRGGVLVYSTCTLDTLENEAVVEKALDMGFEVDDSIVVGGRFKSDLGLRFSPVRDGTPGFFVSYRLVKRG